MSGLNEMIRRTTMDALTTYAQHYIDREWERVWEENLPEIERIYEKGGDSAYGFFCLKLFHPLEAEMVSEGLTPRPVFPGTFPQSEEHWGPWEERERRFWSVLHGANEKPLGTLVTRIFHDHTRLRLPKPPQIYAIDETDPLRIFHAIVHGDPPNLNPAGGGVYGRYA